MSTRLTITTQGVKGGKSHTSLQGCTEISIMDNDRTTRIFADSFEGQGLNYLPRAQGYVRITSYDPTKDKEWITYFDGTAEELVGRLRKLVEIEAAQAEKRILLRMVDKIRFYGGTRTDTTLIKKIIESLRVDKDETIRVLQKEFPNALVMNCIGGVEISFTGEELNCRIPF